MSTSIFNNEIIQATLFCGPERPDGADRRMVQIDTWSSHRHGTGISLRLDELREILLGVEREIHPEGDKTGLALILDRVEAVRVRIDSCSNELPVGNYEWQTLLKEALVEVVKLRANGERIAKAWDIITGNLALAVDAPPEDVAAAVKICVRDNQRKEQELAQLRERPAQLMGTPHEDPEIALLGTIIAGIKKLEPAAQRRVADYVKRLVPEG